MSSIVVGEQPIFTRRKLRVIAVGAGFASLTLAYKHKYGGDHSYIDLTIYEKNPNIGGTWYENRYPGVACDVPSHIVSRLSCSGSTAYADSFAVLLSIRAEPRLVIVLCWWPGDLGIYAEDG